MLEDQSSRHSEDGRVSYVGFILNVGFVTRFPYDTEVARHEALSGSALSPFRMVWGELLVMR
jgi:hypothetical protein